MNSDTPRTDAALAGWDLQDLEFGHKFRELKSFARKLETELNEAKDQVSFYKAEWEHAKEQRDAWKVAVLNPMKNP